MKTRLISCNRDWTSLTIFDKSGKHHILSYNDIDQVKLGYFTEKKLFSKRTSEKIEIVLKNNSSILLTKFMDWDSFDQYKMEVIKFAQDNRITIVN